MTDPRPRSICILGGGTAGWMAANLFQHHWGELGTRIQLIESSAIGIIGVGEGSTPQLKAFFDKLGIAERDWMPRCGATYKTGIEFIGWSDRPGFERYFHPFPTDLDSHTAPLFFNEARARRNGLDVPAHPDPYFIPGALARERLAPLPSENFPFETSYGYHFNAHRVGAYLREVAMGRGVEHMDARIASVDLGGDGKVAALVSDDGRRFEADLFVDASGFRAVIIEGALGEVYRSFADNLFNDGAVVCPTPTPDGGPDVCTRSFAKSAGWIWQIPLTERVGNGYVYSSRYLDREQADSELRNHLGLGEDSEVRHLTMRVGRMDRSWVRNCLAIGLAQGFVEPLDATALHMVIATVEGFIRAVDSEGETERDRFNADVAKRYEGIRDYLVCHYRTAQRSDTDYWRDATRHDHLSDSLKQIMTTWFTGGDLVQEVLRQGIEGYYSPVSWHCLLAGYGNFPRSDQLRPAPGGGPDMAAVDRFIRGCLLNFPTHRDALARLEAP